MTSAVAIREAAQVQPPEISALFDLSRRIGRDPLLVQASSGNTSVKVDGTLWVKASGKWLANADQEELLFPIELSNCLDRFRRREYFPTDHHGSPASRMDPSIETFLHAVLQHRVVVHVHSVNTIEWAVREDAVLQLERLYGLRWRWIPYATSGLDLARKIRSACRRHPDLDIFVLGNRGLVVCGDKCGQVENLLLEVERRLASPPRVVPQPNYSVLEQVQRISGWRLPDDPAIHTLGTDGHSRRMIQRGVLYPLQAMILGPLGPHLARHEVPSRLSKEVAKIRRSSPFLVVERRGVLVRAGITADEDAALKGYSEIVRRIETSAMIRYLRNQEVRAALRAGEQYRI